MSERSEDLNLYLNFIHLALMGLTKRADDILENHLKSILRVAQALSAELDPEEHIYRGILLEPKYIIEDDKGLSFKALPHIKFESYSTSIEIAKDFADVNSYISELVMQFRPKSKGYIMETSIDKSKVLFHHSWVKTLQLWKALPNIDYKVLYEQKEVITLITKGTNDIKAVEGME